MKNKIEHLIKSVYSAWKTGQGNVSSPHPDEEALVCFIEGRLPPAEFEQIKAHLISCGRCAGIFSLQVKLKPTEERQVPAELLERIKNLVAPEDKLSILEILLRVKEEVIEVLNTTGDILMGQELVPAPVLRSRQIKEFKDEVIILKDFKDITVEIKIENKHGKYFNLTVLAKEKSTQSVIKDLRVTLLKDALELESYLADSGKVIFEHVLLGKYRVEISDTENKVASILLDIKR